MQLKHDLVPKFYNKIFPAPSDNLINLWRVLFSEDFSVIYDRSLCDLNAVADLICAPSGVIGNFVKNVFAQMTLSALYSYCMVHLG